MPIDLFHRSINAIFGKMEHWPLKR